MLTKTKVVKRWRNKIRDNIENGKPWYYGFPYKWWWGKAQQQFLMALPEHLNPEQEPEWFTEKEILELEIPIEGKVSILIPNYNYDRYLRRAIDSALSQTHPDVEIVVVDDGSTDSSVKILKKYQAKRQIKLVIHDRNYGYQKAINTAISHSSGKFLMVLDSDDTLVPQCVEVLMREIKRRGCDAAYPQLKYVKENLKLITVVKPPFPINDLGGLPYGHRNCANMMLFSRHCLKFMEISPGQWRDERYKSNGDVEWILRFLKHGKLCHVKQPLYIRRKHEYKPWSDDSFESLRQILEELG